MIVRELIEVLQNADSKSTILIMRKRRVLLRQALRRQIARLEKIQQKEMR